MLQPINITGKNRVTEIALSKRKITRLFIGSLLFVALGLWFIGNPYQFTSAIIPYKIIIIILGIICVLFFGLAAFYNYKKLMDDRPGLVISDEGVIDNSSGFSAGKIWWNDVSEIRSKIIFKQKLLLLILSNPDEYIEREKNPLRKKAMHTNLKTYGAPFGISAAGLKIDFDELKSLLEKKLEDYRNNPGK